MAIKTKKKAWEPIVEYHYVGHKNEEEEKENKRRVDKAYDILFEATLEEMNKEKESK